jgi:hypothetical protein
MEYRTSRHDEREDGIDSASKRTVRRLGRVLNVVIAALSLLLVLRIVDGLDQALTGPLPASAIVKEPTALPSAPRHKAWSEVEPIVERNLFGVDVAGRPEPEPVELEVEIEASSLPLALLGTISSTDSDLGAAAVWVDPAKERVVVSEGDQILAWDATVVEISRGRILLDEDGELRELSIADDSEYRPPKRTIRRRRGRRFRRGTR